MLQKRHSIFVAAVAKDVAAVVPAYKSPLSRATAGAAPPVDVRQGLFRRYGIPRRIRVDNEACFVSHGLSFALNLLGIRLQRIQPHCPWQNGRIERLFGTLKQQLDRVCIVDTEDLRRKLVEFHLWYNHARPHQHLRGRTPAEAWDGRAKATGSMLRFEGWEGRLVGWYCSG